MQNIIYARWSWVNSWFCEVRVKVGDWTCKKQTRGLPFTQIDIDFLASEYQGGLKKPERTTRHIQIVIDCLCHSFPPYLSWNKILANILFSVEKCSLLILEFLSYSVWFHSIQPKKWLENFQPFKMHWYSWFKTEVCSWLVPVFFVIKMKAPEVWKLSNLIGLDQYNFLHCCGMGLYTESY